ncbi:hypothetical protein HNQ07_003599 [Deinococcus metalli]|uniref:Galactose oxidase n=1 Tax=Deinococcus metalli TaxID=1141878 RepID=A0A7W8KJ37_9DEIO|nr:hypothetical protein [Deinococcus metalli]MBB5378098.1 hypothetical protein [Deinococcus metalli]GHF54422.1 hypothetical protein GCM10017781_33420 [Deinococcus metalli]
MKNLLTGALLLGLTACGSSSPTPTPTPTKTVNDIVLTPTQLSLPLTTFDAGTYPLMSVLVGASIYFGNGSNSGTTQFLTRYDLSSNTFSSPLAVSTNVCFCGYSSKLVSDGVNIFYIANDATKYTASSNTWTTINYPTTARDNAGEAGVTYYNGNIYYLGGRTPSNLFKYYSIAQNSWFTAPNYLYATNRSQMAVYKDRIYVLGGTNAAKKMASFSTSTNTWTPLADTPFTVNASYDSIYTAVLGDDLYILQGETVYIYDLVKDVWATAPAKLSNLPSAANLFSDGQNLYIAGQNASRIPAVVKVVVSVK